MNEIVYRILSLVLSLTGLFFIINSQSNVIGAVIGISYISPILSPIIGFSLILISLVIVTMSSGGGGSLEEVLKKKKIGEVAALGREEWKKYLHIREKELVPETYSKHLGKRYSYLVSKYPMVYSRSQIVELEKRVIFEGVPVPKKTRPHLVRVYSVLDHPIGISKGKDAFGIVIDLQERGGKIYYHGHPLLEDEIPKDIKKKIVSRGEK